jgi:arginyl-tRNA synthetase
MAVDHDERVERSAHLAYEKVTLSPAAAEQLGQQLSEEDRKRGAVSMSGRKGLGVKTDDLIDQLEIGALAKVKQHNPELSDEEQSDTAHKIAVGALRYFLLKYLRNSIIAFDFEEALTFSGETGPYIQYTIARINSIYRELANKGIDATAIRLRDVEPSQTAENINGKNSDELWSLVYNATRLPEIIRGAVATLEPALVAKWAFELAQSFNGFYHKKENNLKKETSPARLALLVEVSRIVQQQLTAALDVLGIQAPERM